MKMDSSGFIQVPVILAILIIGAAGTYTAVNAPRAIKEYQEKQLQKKLVENNLPAGTSSSETILIGFKDGVTSSQQNQVHQQNNSALKKRIGGINTDVIRVPVGVSPSELIGKYRQNPRIEYAEPNFLASAFLIPNDPYYPNQWNLKKVAAEEAYEIARGGGTLIAVIDTGVDNAHQDLSGIVLEGLNTIEGNNNTLDDNGHGTHVAGIASAQTNNSGGIASISYKSSILPVKVLTKDGYGTYGDISEGVIFAADKGARILNLSLGGSSDSETLKRAVKYAHTKGSLIVAAAGNYGSDTPVYPAAYPEVLAVSASDQNDNLAPFSSYGSNIFVSSPGVSILSSVPGNTYKQYSGTSMAAPHLAGLLALSLAYKPDLTNEELIGQIKNNTEKAGSFGYDENGWNPYFGYGRISAGKTLASAALDETIVETTLTPVPDIPSQYREQERQGYTYTYSYDLHGIVEEIDPGEGKFTVKIEKGSLKIMEQLSGNLIEVYTDYQTIIKYQNSMVSLMEIVIGSRVNVKGQTEQNKLLASEILLTYLPAGTAQGNNENLNQNQNTGEEIIPDQSSGQQDRSGQTPASQFLPESPGQPPGNVESVSNGNGSGMTEGLQDQGSGQGKVRGANTLSFWQIFLKKMADLFR